MTGHMPIGAEPTREADAAVGPRPPVADPARGTALQRWAEPLRVGAGPSTAATVLALQRTAGNRAVARAVSAARRSLARCPSCGGRCQQAHEEEDELEGATRVLQRDFDPLRRGSDNPAPDGGSPDAPAPGDAGDGDSTLAPDNPSREQDPSVTIGVCGPDISRQFASTLTQIKTDFGRWSQDDQRRACKRIMWPVRLDSAGHVSTDLNGWDIHALFLGEAQWLRRRPVCPPCATPSSSNPTGNWGDKGHEDPRTCSDTVQVGNACWLAGTPNYGTFGMMLSLCRDAFTGDPGDNDTGPWPDDFLSHGQALIKGYKLLVSHEDPKWPLAWTEAVYKGGPSATLPGGNRQSCTTTCGKVNKGLDISKLANWDYVWEPVHPRYKAPQPAPAPSGSVAPSGSAAP